MKECTDSKFTRRACLKTSLAGTLGVSLPGWFARLAQCAQEPAIRGKLPKRCIMLWMDGGPSQLDTFDPKPEAASEVRGPFGAIATSVPGIQIGERFPKLARQMQHLAILRGMSTDEADHGRARIYMHTGYKPGFGGVTYPSLGSLVSAELGDAEFPLPHFVATGSPLGKYDFVADPGYLGPRHAALSHSDATRPLENLDPLASDDEFRRRAAVLEEIQKDFAASYRATPAEAHRAVFDRAVRLMRADSAKAFDISLEPASSREEYGDSNFGRGCLLARRLVEAGVSFVEVYAQNWDTHEKRSFDAAAELMPHVDQGMAALIADLARRGLLDSTLLIWMGEFGRTPRMNRNGGRDHYAAAWSTVLAGCGIRGGQTIGRTDHSAASVADRPVSAVDFMATVCHAMGIDHTKEVNTPIGRPVSIVQKQATPIQELF